MTAPLLFFDTETTGVPRDPRASIADSANWPHIVQMAWAVFSPDGERLSAEEHLVRPDGFTIPNAATRVHGITTAAARKHGKPLAEILERFLAAVEDGVTALVAHNAAFDQSIVAAELCRLGHPMERIEAEFLSRPFRCTMEESRAFCGLPGRHSKYKAPTLAELHTKLFGGDPPPLHTALADVEACARCFFELRRRGVVE